MGDVVVCRSCLITDVKMYNLHVFPLGYCLNAITGLDQQSMDLPPYICYECAAVLKKCHLFRERCLIGQSLLYGILNMSGQITPYDIKQLNRQELNLASPLGNHTQSGDSIHCFVHEEVSEEEIKSEPADDNDHGFLMEILPIKEDSSNGFPMISSDDDEPLSLHKEKKVQEKLSKKKKKKDVDDFINYDVQFCSESEEEDLEESLEMKASGVPRKKRGRPKKSDTSVLKGDKKKLRRTRNTGGVAADDIDLEEYVTIIKLSVEEQMDEITKRQQSSNYLNAQFQCNLCYKGFIDTRAWKHHVSKHDPSAGDIECPICKFRFKTKRTLQKHSANHEKKFACKSCPYVSKTTTQAKQHQRWHKGVTYKCQYCDEVSTKWTSYLSHVRIKHPSEFICGVCGYSFVSKLGLTMHRTMMHKGVPEPDDNDKVTNYCQECDVKFVSLEAYKRHMVTSVKHTQSNDFSTGCRVCGETFKSSEELRIHHRKEHARKRPKNYGKKPSNITWPATCEHCSEEIPNAREYWTHFRRVHPDKTYPIQKNHICDICGKSFRGNAFLVYHKRTHFEERAYKCAQCPKAFFNRTNLQMHEKTHSDTRPYPCNVCYKAFKSKGALDRHFRSHTGVKPYECEVCGKAFGQSNSRKLHVRTVHLKQPAPYVSRSRVERRRQAVPFGY